MKEDKYEGLLSVLEDIAETAAVYGDDQQRTIGRIKYAKKFIEALIQEQVIAELEKLKSQNVAIPCEPDCTPIRHARHEGAWEQHLEFDDFIDERIKELKGDK